MAKQNGIGLTVLVDTSADSPTDISNDITNCNWRMPVALQDVTGLDKSAMERITLLADFELALSGVFNASLSHTVLEDVNEGVPRTTTLQIASLELENELLFDDYPLTRGADGSFGWSTTGRLADGTLPAWGSA